MGTSAHRRIYFDDKAAELKDHPMQSDVPEGFDFVLTTHEPEAVLSQVNRNKFITVLMNSTVVLIGLRKSAEEFPEYEFDMFTGKDGPQIGYISAPNFDKYCC